MSKNECLEQLTFFSNKELSQAQKPKPSPFRYKKEYAIGNHSHIAPSFESPSVIPQEEEVKILALDDAKAEGTPEEKRKQDRITLGVLGALGAAGLLALTYCLWEEGEINKYKQSQYSHNPNESLPVVVISMPPSAEASYHPSTIPSPKITPLPTLEAISTPYPSPMETPLEFTVDQPFIGEAGQIYKMDAWYLVNGDVRVRSNENQEFVSLYDNLEETAEQVIVGPGSQVTGDYGFSATSLYGEPQFILDDKNQEIINQSMDSKFDEIIYGPNGQYQFETIKLDLLSADGTIKNIDIVNRGEN